MSKELIISASPHETRVAIVEDGQLCEIYVEREKELALVGSIYKGRVTRVLPGMQSAFVDIGLDSDAFLYVSDFLEELDEYDSVATVEDKVEKMEQQGGEVFAEPAASPAAVASSDAQPIGDEDASQAKAGEAREMPVAESREAQPPAPPPSQPAARSDDLPGESRAPADPNAPRSDFPRESRLDSRRGDSRRGDSRGFRSERGGDRGERGGGDRFGRGGGRDRFGGRRGGRSGRGGGSGGGGRGREFPPSKFSPHRPYEAPDHSEPGEVAERIILPGESLAKYNEPPVNAPAEASLPESGPAAETRSALSEAREPETTEHNSSPRVESAGTIDSAVQSPEPSATESPRHEAQPQSDEPVSAWSSLRMRDTSAELAPPQPGAIAQAPAAEPADRHTGDDDLTDDQAANLAEQMSEVEHERSQDEAVLDSVEEENGAEENGHASDENNRAASEEITQADRKSVV